MTTSLFTPFDERTASAYEQFKRIPFNLRTEADCIQIVSIYPQAIKDMILSERTPSVLLTALQTDADISLHLCPADILQAGAEHVRDFLLQNNCSLRLSCYDALEAKRMQDEHNRPSYA